MDSVKKIIKWAVYAFIAFIAFCVLVAIFTDDDEQPKNNQELSAQEDGVVGMQEDGVVGIYEVTDKVGCTIQITLKEDETAVVKIIKGGGEGSTFYCSWSDDSVLGEGISISYSGDGPTLVYEGGAEDGYVLHLKDGWIYQDAPSVKAKNPQWRLKATKIK